MKTKKKQQNIDMGEVLRKVNSGDLTYFETIQNDEVKRKKLSPFILFYYMKGAQKNKAAHTILTNDRVNPYLFHLGAHPLCLYYLIVAANSGIDNGRYTFHRPNQKPATKDEKAVMWHFVCSLSEARDTIKVIDQAELDHIKDLYQT